MRGAPFMLWITDLSRTIRTTSRRSHGRDDVLAAADDAGAPIRRRRKVMMLMPVMFLFFFLWAPSGLVIYWSVSNLLGIGQQYCDQLDHRAGRS